MKRAIEGDDGSMLWIEGVDGGAKLSIWNGVSGQGSRTVSVDLCLRQGRNAAHWLGEELNDAEAAEARAAIEAAAEA